MSDPQDRAAYDLAILSSPADLASARALAGTLAQHGVRLAWWPADPPAAAALAEAAQRSRWVCVLWSAASRGDERLGVVARQAFERLALVQVQLDLGEVPAGLGSLPSISLAGWQGQPQEPVFQELVGSLAQLLGVSHDRPVPIPASHAAPRSAGFLGRVGGLVGSLWRGSPASATQPLPDAVRRVPKPADAEAFDRFERTVPLELELSRLTGQPSRLVPSTPHGPTPAPTPTLRSEAALLSEPPADRLAADEADTAATPLDSSTTPVWLCASAPLRAAPGQTLPVRLAVFASSARGMALAQLTAARHEASRFVVDLAPDEDSRWRQGAPLQVRLGGGGQRHIEPGRCQLVWDGMLQLATFQLTLPVDAAPAVVQLSLELRLAQLPLALVTLPLTITEQASNAELMHHTEPQQVPRTLYASYASRESTEVSHRLATLQRWAPDLAIFQDCLDLTPSEELKPQLAQQIAERDAFLLFWSRRAAASPHVQWELQEACRSQGRELVLPVPLEDPAIAPPPPEFATSVWRERFLLAGEGLQHLQPLAEH